MTILFCVLFFIFFGNLLNVAIRTAWGTMKVMFYVLFLPLMIVGLMLKGIFILAIPLFVFLGLMSMLKTV
ncbi:hypothetical protein [Butyrivibrio sp. MC2021]|uniref:hypothetical protein n=1 Tax=Butyrivibrio sp. MC2021 TaxID=1408306 RepID=UPI00056A4581|nr:hypothetical protein [Butyrivibrio sp. MC2021]